MIEIYVSGNEIKQSGQNCGVCGEGNSTEMHLIFGSDWDSYSKRVVFYDAHGQTPTAVLISGSSAVQTISIPFEPLKYEGDIEYVIEGSKENTKKKSVAGRLRVRYAPMTDGAGAPEDVTPTQAEQLQILIAAAESAAKEYADTKAETAEGNAKAYADSKAQAAETAAKEYADGKSSVAETAAKSHADTKASAAEKSAKEYADSIKPTKVSQLENDSGYLPSADAIGKKGVGTGAEIFNDYENNKAYGPYSSARGYYTKAGCTAFRIMYRDTETNSVTLDSVSGLAVGDTYSIHCVNNGDEREFINAGRIVSIDTSSHTVKLQGDFAVSGINEPNQSLLYIIKKPDIGTEVLSGYCYADGILTWALRLGSRADGLGTIATMNYQHARGIYNEIDNTEHHTIENGYLDIVGNGNDENDRSNAYTLSRDGVGWFAGGLKVGGSGQYDGAAKDVATVEQVTAKANEAETAAKSYADTKLEKKVDKEEGYTLSKVRDLELSYGDDCVLLEVTKTSDAGIVGPTNPIEPTSDSVDETESISTYSSSSVVWEVESCDFYNTEQANNKNAETLAAAKNYTDTKLKGKADRYAISASVTGNTLLLADKSDTQLLSAAAATLTLTLPETVTSGYECFFSFKSGATATTLTVPSGITWTGTDCNSGKEFVPLANTVYEVGIRCIGFSSDGTPYLSARVGAC